MRMTADQPDRSTGPVNDIDVLPRGKGWAVRRTGRSRASAVYPTQDEAACAAHAMVRAKGGRVVVHERDGRYRHDYVLGREAFDKISAVEGIYLDAAMRRDLRETRERHISADEVRRVIAAKYGTRRS